MPIEINPLYLFIGLVLLQVFAARGARLKSASFAGIELELDKSGKKPDDLQTLITTVIIIATRLDERQRTILKLLEKCEEPPIGA